MDSLVYIVGSGIAMATQRPYLKIKRRKKEKGIGICLCFVNLNKLFISFASYENSDLGKS